MGIPSKHKKIKCIFEIFNEPHMYKGGAQESLCLGLQIPNVPRDHIILDGWHGTNVLDIASDSV